MKWTYNSTFKRGPSSTSRLKKDKQMSKYCHSGTEAATILKKDVYSASESIKNRQNEAKGSWIKSL